MHIAHFSLFSQSGVWSLISYKKKYYEVESMAAVFMTSTYAMKKKCIFSKKKKKWLEQFKSAKALVQFKLAILA